MSEPINLLSLPNCLILQLLSYLDATSLYFLSKTCTRFSDFIKSHGSLWKRIDARRYPNNEKKRLYCLRRGHAETHTFLLREDKEPAGNQPRLEKSFFTNLKRFSNLRVLAIENQTLNGTQYKISSFPVYLEEFSLKRSTVLFPDSFFRHSSESMKNLRVLILDECNWLVTGDFMPISKYKNLEILSVFKCGSLKNSIAYLSLSGYGFKQLKVFDARLSPLGNTLLRSIYKCPSLLSIYFQNDDKSYKLDYYKRKLEVASGASSRDFYTDDSDLDIESENGVVFSESPTLSDCGLIDYSQVANLKHDLKNPKSVLYLDPYNPCSCGYKGKGKRLLKSRDKKNSSNSDDSDDDDDYPDDRSLRKLKTLVKTSKKAVNKRGTPGSRNRTYCDSSSPPHVMGSTVVINLRRSMARVLHEPHQNVCVLNVFGSSNENPRPNIHVVHLNDEVPPQNIEVNEHINHVIDVLVNRCRKRPRDDSTSTTESKAKKAMMDEDPVPGPSGCVNNPPEPVSDESGISDGEEPQPYAERPPTPHPDIVVKIGDEQERNYHRLVNVSPIVIEPYSSKKKINLPLRRLSLRGYRTITNRSLNYINHLGLEVLDLTYTDVTEDAINVYLIDNPNCRVIHEKFCVCSPNLHF